MAKQGAALQNYNNELVKSLEELCQRRQLLQTEIDREVKEKEELLAQQKAINERLQAMDNSLGQKLTTKAEYDRIIGEAEQAYMKILESSQVLLNVVKSRSKDLKNTSPNTNLRDSNYLHYAHL